MARPTKYKTEFCDFSKYLTECETLKEVPSLCGYACFLGVAESTLELWQTKHPAFSGSLAKLLTIEKKKLINNGLNSTYNSTIAKMLLNVNHGMKEDTNVNIGGQKGNRIPIPVIMFGIPETKNDNT